VVRHAARHVHDVAIGKFIGTVGLGLYSRAYTVLMLTLDLEGAVGVVAQSGLSRLQDEPERYRAFFRKALLAVIAFGMPVVMLLSVEAPNVVRTFLGPQWTEAVPILQMLTGVAFVSTFAGATQWVYLSCGRADRQLRWWFFELAVQALAVTIGIRWGILGVAAAASVAHVILTPAKIFYCIRISPLRASDVFGVLWQPALASWTAAGLVFALHRQLGASAWPVLDLALGTACFTLAYLGCWMLLPGGAANVRGLLKMTKELRSSASPAAARG
jgi:O-antigen/teichoic acid export membrane protein